MIDHADLVPAMNKKYGNLYVKDAHPARTSTRAWTADNQQATVMNLLVAHQNMDDKTAYNIVKAIFDHRDELIRVHKEAENFKLENQKTDGVVAFPGIRARSSTSRRRASSSSRRCSARESPVQHAGGAFSFVGGAMSEEVARLHQPAAEVSARGAARAPRR